mmetsp:Transcript_1914/g.7145  ORF Transcript_1914/g.7145 Transcript_1914/m.7145 type:complete len:251 (-) Transcript_1914:161-913(-)
MESTTSADGFNFCTASSIFSNRVALYKYTPFGSTFMRSARPATCSTDSSPLAYKTPPPLSSPSAPLSRAPINPATCNNIVDFPTPGSPPTKISPPGTTPPPSTRSISFPSSPAKDILGIVGPELKSFGFNTSRNARGALVSDTHPPTRVVRPPPRPIPPFTISFSAILATARAPAPPPAFAFAPDAGSLATRTTLSESHALQLGHCPYHCFVSSPHSSHTYTCLDLPLAPLALDDANVRTDARRAASCVG